ncbi:hypothetical protein [Streptomyces sp. AC627_RSS907]|uniref:hypothetical protein n=1 Tax=Streptomyces sp. AC627_RSS907 TaxID=2823684 RepID=UPI001C2325D8|nr:hypothetical protein [Streptomyces sp. AC627_RSS907]
MQLLSQDGVKNTDLSSGELDGALAVRREYIAEADSEKGADLASRRVEYIVSVPDDPNRWFVAAFSTGRSSCDPATGCQTLQVTESG